MGDYKQLPGDDFLSPQFNIITVFIISILVRQTEKRHQFFNWVITLLAPVLVCLGTIQRLQINWSESSETGLGRSQVEDYITLSLTSWIGCIIMDGTHAFHIYRVSHTSLLQHLVRRWSVMETVELAGMLVSCVSMLRLGVDVYSNFHQHTHDVSMHAWFFMAVVFKVGRIFIQGLAVTVDSPHLLAQEHKTLTTQIMVSSIFLLIQVVFLALFNPAQFWLSLTLTTGDVLYRIYQCVKIYCYGNHGNANVNHDIDDNAPENQNLDDCNHDNQSLGDDLDYVNPDDDNFGAGSSDTNINNHGNCNHNRTLRQECGPPGGYLGYLFLYGIIMTYKETLTRTHNDGFISQERMEILMFGYEEAVEESGS